MTSLRVSCSVILLPVSLLIGLTPYVHPQLQNVMVVAISRDKSTLKGGISSEDLSPEGKVDVEILAYLTPAGEWKSHPCAQSYAKPCERFAKEYLGKPHRYAVVSTDGRGATVSAVPVTLSECYDYTTTGTYTGASIRKTAIAADSAQMFTVGPPAVRLSATEAQPMVRGLEKLVPSKLDSTVALRMYRVQLEGKSFVVVQRAYQDCASNPKYDTGQGALKFIFAIGANEKGRFQTLYWKDDIEDENEQILGTIHLKNGRDFLITTISDPESQVFHVYGIRDGKFALIYSGGGSSC